MLPFDIDFSEFPNGIPIKFKHDPESREKLKKTRTVDELLDIIRENDMQELVTNAAINNDKEFSHIPFPGYLEKREDNYYIIVDSVNPVEVVVPNTEDFEDIVNTVPLELIDVILYMEDDSLKFYAMIFDSAEEKENFWDDPDMSSIPAITLFLESTGIDTLHKLGKAINKGTELHADYISAYEYACDNNLVDFSNWGL